jgi:hypothetical protein
MATNLQAASQVASAVKALTDLVDAPDRYDIPHETLLPLQLKAADELLQDRVKRIKLLRNRAESGGVTRIGNAADLVPLLFAHTAYKSYPEGWLSEQRWDRLNRWLETVSVNPVAGVDLDGVADIDGWLGRLEAAGHFVSCSSGTTGKCAMLDAAEQDLAWSHREVIASVCWGAGIPADKSRVLIGTGAVAHSPRNISTRNALIDGFARPGEDPFAPDIPPITIGQITGMVALRKAMADGTARPAEISGFEQTSANRQALVEASYGDVAQALVEQRGERLFILGMWSTLHRIAQEVRALGYGAADFGADNAIYIGGGLKGAVLTADYREYVFETFNLRPEHVFEMYGMQEINSSMPRCGAGRYHVPPWVMLLLLDESGEHLIEPTPGTEQEGRAAFFDIALEGRWNGVISGDRIHADYGPCACGHGGPSIRGDIARYSDLPGGDKISCSGTIDAYVRGVA